MRSIFIVNPGSGPQDATASIKAELERLQPKDCEVYVTTAPMDAAHYVRNMCESTTEPLRFFACGGDGTLNEVINGAAGFSHAAVGCYPCGSGNDFVKYYGGKDRFLNLEALVKAPAAPIDLMRVNDRYCVNVCNFGFDTCVARTMIQVKNKKIIGGKRAYGTGVAKALFTAMKTHCRLTADGDELVNGNMLLCTVANGSYVGGSFCCAPRSDNTDGLLEVCMVKPISRVRFLQLLTPYTNGQQLDDPRFRDILVYRRAKTVEVEAKAGFAVSVDGEIVEDTRFRIEVLPGALLFAAPER